MMNWESESWVSQSSRAGSHTMSRTGKAAGITRGRLEEPDPGSCATASLLLSTGPFVQEKRRSLAAKAHVAGIASAFPGHRKTT